MNTSELYTFAIWLRGHARNTVRLYQNLSNVLQHNASESTIYPVEEHVNALVDFLENMDYRILSNEQIHLLNVFGIDGLIGNTGCDYIVGLVTISNFDARTAHEELEAAIAKLSGALSRAQSLIKAFDDIALPLDPPKLPDETILLRVEFKNNASIGTIADWKAWSANWYDIFRGASMARGAAPEETKVVGATRGSIIMEFALTYAATRLAVGIVKSVMSVAFDWNKLLQTREQLRKDKLLNDKIELEINQQIESIKESGVSTTLESIEAKLPTALDGEQRAALVNSIQKLVDFYQLGGEVDFVEPELIDLTDEAAKKATAAVNEIRGLIREYRDIREEVRKLVHLKTTDS